MTLQDLGNIGEFVSAIAVVASLVYLAFQIRQNTRQITQNTQAVELSAIEALMSAASDSRRSVIENEDVARIYHHGLSDCEGLSEIDQTRFRVLMVSVFRAFQSSYQLALSRVSLPRTGAPTAPRRYACWNRRVRADFGTATSTSSRLNSSKRSTPASWSRPPSNNALQLTGHATAAPTMIEFGIEPWRFGSTGQQGQQLNADPLDGLPDRIMPEPVETLNLIVEAAVAIAGFSGVVIAFGRRAAGEWSLVERARFRNLLLTAFLVLFLSLLMLVLLHANTTPATTWRIGSGLWSIIAIERSVATIRAYVRIPQEDPQHPGVGAVAIILGVTLLIVLLSVGNVFVLKEFWPFLTAQVWLFAAACYFFTRLLFSPGRRGPSA